MNYEITAFSSFGICRQTAAKPHLLQQKIRTNASLK